MVAERGRWRPCGGEGRGVPRVLGIRAAGFVEFVDFVDFVLILC